MAAKLQGTNIVVTGAATGIGRATSLLLASMGAQVTAAARDEERLRTLAAESSSFSGGITPLRADLTQEADRAAVIAAAGEVDVLVNNAGLGHHGLVEDMPIESARELLELNVLTLSGLTKRVLPGMLARGRGHIVNVGSGAGFVGVPGEAVYSATKYAVQGFNDALRRELRGRGVKVTLIAPGPIKTEFIAREKTGAPADVPGSMDRGLPVETVSRAIRRALTRRLPGPHDHRPAHRRLESSRLRSRHATAHRPRHPRPREASHARRNPHRLTM
ncbi:MAG: SDR family NAD(P)-dependent oxidoreductase [Actinobacteria bacterium]|nr:SDR family NAD(P)-dependent oxidoreductase [Actinomycetota bacterium]